MPNTPDLKLQAALELLTHKSSAKRRSAAKTLRKLARPETGGFLLDAFQKEIIDARTWETQYQIIMALAATQHTPALPYLRAFANHRLESTMLYIALGDAIVRLARVHDQDPTPVLQLLDSNNRNLIDGAFRAVAMLRLSLDQSAVDRIIEFASSLQKNDALRFWPAAAAASWQGANVKYFLLDCLQSSRDDVRQAANSSLVGQYQRWNPL